MSDGPLVADVVRGSIVESTHVADCVVVDREGSVVGSYGDPLRLAFFRSSAKPIQAAVMLDSGWEPADSRHLALASASHNGEDAHVSGVREMLAAAGLDESHLRCPEALPAETAPEALAAATRPSRIQHNCSGKHAAMLATCVVRGWPLESYREPTHPLQQAIQETVESLTGSLLETAIDGCGVVTFAAPLTALARAFGAVRRDSYRRAAAAMQAHPFLVAGSNRICTALMESVPGAVAKVGAEGLICVAAGDLSIALKVRDGTSRARGPLLLHLMRVHGLLVESPEALAPFDLPVVLGGGRPAGEIRLHR